MRVRFFFNNIQVLLYRLPPILTIFFLVFALAGCNAPGEEEPLIPPPSHPLVREFIGYGVVRVSFTRVLNEPTDQDNSPGFIRQGDIVRIIERQPVMTRSGSEFWVYAEANYNGENSIQGWIQEDVLDVFDNESQAITASRNLSP